MRITAHEILMIQMWHIFDQYFPEAEKDSLGHFWGLNEITTVFLLGLEPALNVLWTSKTQGVDAFLQNYAQLQAVTSVLKEVYTRGNDLLGYLRAAIELLETLFPGTSLQPV